MIGKVKFECDCCTPFFQGSGKATKRIQKKHVRRVEDRAWQKEQAG
jgi:hypothetical protein